MVPQLLKDNIGIINFLLNMKKTCYISQNKAYARNNIFLISILSSFLKNKLFKQN